MASSPKKAAQSVVVHEQPQALARQVEAPASHESAFKLETPKALEAPMAVAKDLGENVRTMVEKGIVETRARYAQAKAATEEASAAVEASYGAARNGAVAFNVKAIEAFKADADANFDLFKSLAAAKSMSEVVTLQTEFARKRFEEAASRSKELAELARKVADEAIEPIKAHVAKTFKVAV